MATILEWAGPKIGFGSFGTSKQLEHFQAKEAPQRVFAYSILMQKRPGAHASSVAQEVFSSFKYEKRPNLVFFWLDIFLHKLTWSCHVMPVTTNRNMPQPSLRGSCLGGCCLGVFVWIFLQSCSLILDIGMDADQLIIR